jgi:glycosyltransferase involved in cell wall biosynthesis
MFLGRDRASRGIRRLGGAREMLTNPRIAGALGPMYGASPDAARRMQQRVHRSGRAKILLIAPRFPYPPHSGGKLFLLHLARALRGFDVTLLSICCSREEMEWNAASSPFAEIHKVFLPKWRSIVHVLSSLPTRTPLQLAYYDSAEFRARVEELVPRHDLVIAHLIRTGQYVACEERIPKILLMSDAISMSYERMAGKKGSSVLWNVLYRLEQARLRSYEEKAPQDFEQTWLHSDIDRRFLGLDPGSTRIIPVGIDLDEFPFRSGVSGNVVGFVGNMSFSLNADACFHFIRDILPRLRRHADIRFRVIGSCPPSIQRKLKKHPAVEITGAVDRITEAVDGVFCGVCPIRAGAGIQNKILNYLAMGIPCVTSEIGYEGTRAARGRDLLVYERAEDAADLILKLHGNARLRNQLAVNGRRLVEKVFDWNILYKSIREETERVLYSDLLRLAAG